MNVYLCVSISKGTVEFDVRHKAYLHSVIAFFA